MWALIYVGAFLVTFIASAAFKMTWNPLGDKYSVQWDDSVGTTYTDLSYGPGEANKFDLYLPADDSKETYGLVVYLHAGGFTSGDKSGDAGMLQWLCAKGYVAAGINYTLFGEEHPDANVYTQSVEIRDSIPYVWRRRRSGATKSTGWPSPAAPPGTPWPCCTPTGTGPIPPYP